jgi:hypothetical protein
MSNLEIKKLTDITGKHVQFCNGLKAIIDGGCSLESLGELLEELCDKTDFIDKQVNMIFSNR